MNDTADTSAQNTRDQTPEHRKLLDILGQTLDAMPENCAPDERGLIASVLIAEALSSAARKGLLPMSARFKALDACRRILRGLPPARMEADFRREAKAALAAADLGL